jgi:hypothetical protein
MEDAQDCQRARTFNVQNKVSSAPSRLGHMKAANAGRDLIALPATRVRFVICELFDRGSYGLDVDSRLAGAKVCGGPGSDP